MQLKKSVTSQRLLKKLVRVNRVQQAKLEDAAETVKRIEEKLIQTTLDLSLERKKAKTVLEASKSSESTMSKNVQRVNEENDELKKMLAAEMVCNQQMVPRPECEICGQEYGPEDERAPIILTCGHTLCYQCIQRLAAQRGGSFFSCPFDRKQFYLCHHGLNCLVKNYAIIQLIARRDSTRQPTPCCAHP